MCVDVRTSSLNALEKKEAVTSVYEHEIKVRKPCTISKQRERWTKEEHDKFLDALKLFGRAWRQIEGTKTAVQIQSHAQKFFSKFLALFITCVAFIHMILLDRSKSIIHEFEHPKYREDLWKSCAGATDEKVDPQGSSWTGSNTASNGDVVDSQSVEHVKEPTLPSLRQSANSAFSSIKSNPTKIARGFQPYKRCLVENEIRHPLATGEDRDSEGLQLCL